MTGQREIPPIEDISHLSDHDKLKRLVMFAHLAPSTRNTQPWLFSIREKLIEILPNLERQLPISDPAGREVFLSLGAALTNLVVAADSYGFRYELSIQTNDPKQPVAVLRFHDLETKPNFDQQALQTILDRENNREYYEDKSLPEDFVAWLHSIDKPELRVNVITDKEVKSKIRNIVAEATKIVFTDKDFLLEASQWVRPSLSRYRDGMPGYNVGVPKLVSMFLPFLVRKVNMSKMQVRIHERWIDSAPAVVFLTSPSDTAKDWLAAGQTFEKIALEATRRGINIAVMAAPIEVGDAPQKVQQALNITDRPQMFFRLGFAKKRTAPSPRLPFNRIIK